MNAILRSVIMPEMHLGKLEDSYRQDTVHADAEQISVIAALFSVAILIYGVLDYQVLGFTNLLILQLGLRVILCLSSVAIIIHLRNSKNYEVNDRAVFIWLLIIVILITVILIIDGAIYYYNVPASLLIILGMYLVVPNKFHYRIFPPALFTIINLFIIHGFGKTTGSAEKFALVAPLILGNIVGHITANRLQTYRRQQYKAQYEEKVAHRHIELLAGMDGLTGTLNRRRFMELANKELHRFQRYGSLFFLLFIDIDHFKNINDTIGHQAGDFVLRKFAALAYSQIRQSDLLGRIGGDEFAILLAETTLQNAKSVAARIIEKSSEIMISEGHDSLKLTISIGVGNVEKDDTSIDDILYRADQALYVAKKSGRNRLRESGDVVSQ